MAERNSLSKMLNGEGPVDPGPSGSGSSESGPSGAGLSGSGSAGGSSGSSLTGGPYGTGSGSGSGSVPPTNPTGNGSSSGGLAAFSVSAIRALSGKVAALAPMLEKVSSSLEEAEIEAESFSGGGVVLANVYPQVLALAKDDAKSKSKQLDDIAEKLKSTAATWEKAEQASTVQPAK